MGVVYRAEHAVLVAALSGRLDRVSSVRPDVPRALDDVAEPDARGTPLPAHERVQEPDDPVHRGQHAAPEP